MIGRRRSSAPPLWLELAVVALVAAALRVCVPDGVGPPGVQGAFFGLFIIIAEAIAAGLQAVGHAVMVALVWSVHALWWFAQSLFAALKYFAGQFLNAGKKIWGFFRDFFVNVVRPAWEKFWHFVEWARKTLDHLFRPVFEFLNSIRSELLKFYDRWVRPILDSLEIARKVLRVFSSLGLDWASALDAQLAKLEEKIDAPFRYVLSKINEVINVVNRIVTLDGLLQRLVLLRSIERDIAYVHNEFLNAWHHPLSDDDRNRIINAGQSKSVARIISDARAYITTAGGADAALVDEVVAQVRIDLRAP